MINGRILVTQHRLDEWLREGLAYDARRRDREDGDDYGRYPSGWGLILENIRHHCRSWDFGPADQLLIEQAINTTYYEAYKFLNLDNPSQSHP